MRENYKLSLGNFCLTFNLISIIVFGAGRARGAGVAGLMHLFGNRNLWSTLASLIMLLWFSWSYLKINIKVNVGNKHKLGRAPKLHQKLSIFDVRRRFVYGSVAHKKTFINAIVATGDCRRSFFFLQTFCDQHVYCIHLFTGDAHTHTHTLYTSIKKKILKTAQ